MRKKIVSTVSFTLQSVLVISLGMLVGAFLSADRSRGADDASRGAVATEHTAVKVTSQRNGEAVEFFVHNDERCEITMTFDFYVKNMEGEVEFPYTATFLPGTSKAFTLKPIDNSVAWEYAYTNYFKLGSSVALPDAFAYELPYAPGKSFRVTQAFNGRFSHKGSNQHAIDWQMPEGTPVHAARGGLVVKVKDNSDRGGNNVSFDRFNNYVLIRHSDGTLGHYCHLKKGGVKVRPGETVETGQLLALSGNTGYSSGPHLHFCVFKTRNGKERESLPIRFRNGEPEGMVLVEGRRYRAPVVRAPAVARVSDVASVPDVASVVTQEALSSN